MHLVADEIENYIDTHTSEEGEILQQLHRKHLRILLMPQMLSGKVQGQFCR